MEHDYKIAASDEQYKSPIYSPRGSEADHGSGGFEPISSSFPNIVSRLRVALDVAPASDSPIETQLGMAIVEYFKHRNQTLELGKNLVQQFRWSYYRSDWAIITPSRTLLIECDGKAYHSSPEQKAHDAKKDAAALANGYQTIRFTGSEIHNFPLQCAGLIFGALQ